MRRIVFIDHYYGKQLGGGEEYLLSVAKGLQEKGFEVFIICLPDSSLAIAGKDLNLNVVEVPFFTKNLLKSVFLLSAELKKISPHIVNSHGYFSNIVGRLSAKKAGIKEIFCTVHTEVKPAFSTPGQRLSYFFRNWVEIKTSNEVFYIAVSKEIKKQLLSLGIDEKQVFVIYPGLSKDFLNLAKKVYESKDYSRLQKVRFGTCSRLEKVKDIPTLLKAFSLLIADGIDAELIIFGKGSQEKELLELTEKLRISDKVKFEGYKNDSLYFDIDIFCSSSLSEGFNIALLKAQACGIPAVATNVGGQKEIVLDGKTGILVNPKDPEAFKEVMKKIISKKEVLLHFSQNARDRALTFTLEKNINDHLKIFTGLGQG